VNPLWTTIETVLGALLVLGAVVWLGWEALKRSDDPARLIFRWLVSAGIVVGLALFARHSLGSQGGGSAGGGMAGGYATSMIVAGTIAIGGILLGIVWASRLGTWLSRPITSLLDGGDLEVEPRPLYAIAQARRKQGRYLEAQDEVRGQLARFPDDVTGLLLLAEIEAEDLHDLRAATAAIERLVDLPGHKPTTVAPALHRLADWHLKFGQDPEAARAALQRILELYPGTEQAHLTAQRLAHLGSPEFLADRREPHRLRLGEYEPRLGLCETPPDIRPSAPDPPTEAGELVRQLHDHPKDNEARERLALIYAEHYRRLDLAGDQLEQLIAQPAVAPRQVVRWLTMLADLQAKFGGDFEAARRTLERIRERYPGSAAAAAAERHRVHLGVPQQTQTRIPMGGPGWGRTETGAPGEGS
jgi:tetratricopeptide (TPR) repeat protein